MNQINRTFLCFTLQGDINFFHAQLFYVIMINPLEVDKGKSRLNSVTNAYFVLCKIVVQLRGSISVSEKLVSAKMRLCELKRDNDPVREEAEGINGRSNHLSTFSGYSTEALRPQRFFIAPYLKFYGGETGLLYRGPV